jgi:alkylhydroperoxidase/carboxymuconolactone decarboxylase family protein YurZ
LSAGEADRDRLKADVIAARRYWAPFHEGLLQHDPAFLEAYLAFLHGPWRSGALPAKVREFIYIAADLSCAHLYERGASRHMEFALEAGATPAEILQVVELTSALGTWTARSGLAMLGEEVARAGRQPPLPVAADHLAALRQRFEPLLGEWPAEIETLLSVAPAYVEAYLLFLTSPRRTGPLEAKVVEFIGLAVAASPATLYEPGMRFHIRRALAEGATREELAEVLQLAGAISIHSCSIGIPALMALLEGRGGGSAG